MKNITTTSSNGHRIPVRTVDGNGHEALIRYLNGNVFDPEATRAMGEAFDLACQNMRIGGQPAVVKEIMAARIIDAARNGERDPYRLAAKAMDAVGIHLP